MVQGRGGALDGVFLAAHKYGDTLKYMKVWNKGDFLEAFLP
jgi:hypothetical protein